MGASIIVTIGMEVIVLNWPLKDSRWNVDVYLLGEVRLILCKMSGGSLDL